MRKNSVQWFQLISYNKDLFLKFWLDSIKQTGKFTGDTTKVPHTTLLLGRQENPTILKQNKDLKVKLTKYKIEKGKAQLVGKISGNWKAQEKINVEFDVTIDDVGIL